MATTIPIPFLSQPDLKPSFASASEILALEGTIDDRGAVYTRSEVVEFILDLSGYTEEKPLYEQRVLEPSFGGGVFLLQIIQRLIRSWQTHRPHGNALKDLSRAIVGVELHHTTFTQTQSAVIELLRGEGLCENSAMALAERWLYQGDYLPLPLDGTFDFVIGNPPYVRQEKIPAPLLNEGNYIPVGTKDFKVYTHLHKSR